MDNERRNDEGFTLVEMMAVLVIMGLLIGAAVVATGPMRYEALKTRVNADLNNIRNGLEMYNSQIFDYPPEEIGIEALIERPNIDGADRWAGPYIERMSEDPWGRPYIYIYPGDENPFELISYGRDGEPGGEGPDQDLSYWDRDEE